MSPILDELNRHYVGRAPHMRACGLRVTAIAAARGTMSLPALHGGVIAAFTETAALLHLVQTLGGAKLPKGIDFSIDYLRAGRPVESFAQCELVRVGARVALVQVRCWQSSPDKPIVVARGHFLLTDAQQPT